MSAKYILDEQGIARVEPDLMKWATWFENFDHRMVAKDKVGGVGISTVFLGLDHSFGYGPPMLFETMIFGGQHDQYQERYTTRDEALAGHTQAVQLVTESLAQAGDGK